MVVLTIYPTSKLPYYSTTIGFIIPSPWTLELETLYIAEDLVNMDHPPIVKQDLLKASVPFLWTNVAAGMFCYYLVDPFLQYKLPKTIPLYWSLISSFPSYITTINLLFFHRKAVKESGMSPETIFILSKILRFTTFSGILIFIVLSVASAIQLAKCHRCVFDCYFENALWLASSFSWLLAMAWTLPGDAYLADLARRWEEHCRRTDNVRIGNIVRNDNIGIRGSNYYSYNYGYDCSPGALNPTESRRGIGINRQTFGILGESACVLAGKVTELTKFDNGKLPITKGEQLPVVSSNSRQTQTTLPIFPLETKRIDTP